MYFEFVLVTSTVFCVLIFVPILYQDLFLNVCFVLIHFSKRCDINFDCPDKSDERHCAYLSLDDNYGRELIPRDDSGGDNVING